MKANTSPVDQHLHESSISRDRGATPVTSTSAFHQAYSGFTVPNTSFAQPYFNSEATSPSQLPLSLNANYGNSRVSSSNSGNAAGQPLDLSYPESLQRSTSNQLSSSKTQLLSHCVLPSSVQLSGSSTSPFLYPKCSSIMSGVAHLRPSLASMPILTASLLDVNCNPRQQLLGPVTSSVVTNANVNQTRFRQLTSRNYRSYAALLDANINAHSQSCLTSPSGLNHPFLHRQQHLSKRSTCVTDESGSNRAAGVPSREKTVVPTTIKAPKIEVPSQLKPPLVPRENLFHSEASSVCNPAVERQMIDRKKLKSFNRKLSKGQISKSRSNDQKAKKRFDIDCLIASDPSLVSSSVQSKTSDPVGDSRSREDLIVAVALLNRTINQLNAIENLIDAPAKALFDFNVKLPLMFFLMYLNSKVCQSVSPDLK